MLQGLRCAHKTSRHQIGSALITIEDEPRFGDDFRLHLFECLKFLLARQSAKVVVNDDTKIAGNFIQTSATTFVSAEHFVIQQGGKFHSALFIFDFFDIDQSGAEIADPQVKHGHQKAAGEHNSPVSQLQQRNFSHVHPQVVSTGCKSCLLYTSDAADDLLCVDLGGRRIIKK